MLFYLRSMPHVFSRLQPETKKVYRKKYQSIKKDGSASAIAGVGLNVSKLKTYGSKFKKVAIATAEI